MCCAAFYSFWQEGCDQPRQEQRIQPDQPRQEQRINRQPRKPSKMWPCLACVVQFDSRHRLGLHYQQTHGKRAAKVPPPHGDYESGCWMATEHFPGKKSFGWYNCEYPGCDNKWLSAHAFKDSYQECKRCAANCRAVPLFMWFNFSIARERKQQIGTRTTNPISSICAASATNSATSVRSLAATTRRTNELLYLCCPAVQQTIVFCFNFNSITKRKSSRKKKKETRDSTSKKSLTFFRSFSLNPP